MTECSLLTYSFVLSFFLLPVGSLSIFFSSLTRSFVLGSFFYYLVVRLSLTRSLVLTVVCSLSFLLLVGSCLVHSFVLSPVCSFSRSYVRCLFSYSFVRAWFIRLFFHPFARSHGRTFVVPYLARSFVLGSFTAFILWFVCLIVCSLTRLLVLTVVRLLSLLLLVLSGLVRPFVIWFVHLTVCSLTRLLVLTVVR